MLFYSVIAQHTLLDIPREVEITCYTVLPVVCVQTKSVDVLQGVFELDLQRYVSWYRQWNYNFRAQNVTDAVTFFRWMELKVRLEVHAQITFDR